MHSGFCSSQICLTRRSTALVVILAVLIIEKLSQRARAVLSRFSRNLVGSRAEEADKLTSGFPKDSNRAVRECSCATGCPLAVMSHCCALPARIL